MSLQILTANRLTDGVVVWYDKEGQWNEKISGSDVARTKDDAARLEAIGKQAFADNLVVDVNLIDIEEVDGRIRPLRLRERIRAEGPTIEYAV
jgi:predicted secreted protein